MKLIFSNSLPTSRTFGEKMDAWWYEAQGVDVEFWDIAPLFVPADKLESFYSGAPGYRYIGPKHRVFSSWPELEDALRHNRNSLLWHLSRFDRMHDDDRWIDLLNSHRIVYFFQHVDPVERGAMNWNQRLRSEVRALKQRWHARYCMPQAVVTSGTVGRRHVETRYPDSHVISIPSVKVLWHDKTALLHRERFVAFVDESVAFQPDSQLGGWELSYDTHGYYTRMRDMFSRIEDTLGMPVRIGCSTKYIYPDPEQTFGGREVAYGKTLEWVHSGVLTIGHSSLALDQAIVSRRPVLLVSDAASTPYYKQISGVTAKRFRQQHTLNVDINKARIQASLEQPLDHYEAVEHAYFCEPGVFGDYRMICLNAFRKYV